ncbi:hypothetical protein AM593_04048, partial [Mytilus galloprovincialis]
MIDFVRGSILTLIRVIMYDIDIGVSGRHGRIVQRLVDMKVEPVQELVVDRVDVEVIDRKQNHVTYPHVEV